MAIEKLLTPTGRIVWGNPAKPQVKKDQRTKQPVMKDGQPVQQWAFGLAIPKQEFFQYIKPYMDQEAATAYPHGTPQQFSWKYKDGDSIDSNGKPYALREGYAGHVVMTISTTAFAPPIFKFENGAYRQITPEEIKCGDYVRVNMNMKVNVPTDRTHTPGIFVNPNGIEFVAYGQEIITSGGDPDEMFGGQQAVIPAGGSAVPVSSAPMGVTMPMGQPPMQPPQAPAQGYPAPAAAPQPYPMQQPPMQAPAPIPQQMQAPQGYAQPAYAAPAPQAPAQGYPAPAHDFVQNAGQPAPTQGYAAPLPAPAPQQQMPGQAPMQMPQGYPPQGR